MNLNNITLENETLSNLFFEQLKGKDSSNYIFQKMFDAIPISMLLVNPKGKIVFSNRHTEQLFGYDKLELLGKEIETLIPEETRTKHVNYRNEYMKLPKVRPMGLGRNLFGLRIDKTKFPIEIGLTPVRTKEGLFVLASIVDISENEYVKERLTLEKEEKKKLEVVNDRLAEFSHIVGHDLNDPLVKIETFLPVVLSNAHKEKESCDAINIINDSIKRSKDLIKNLLHYAQSSSVQLEEVNLNLLINEIIETYSIEEKIKFKIGKLPVISADSTLTKLLFCNLISNAVKFRKPLPEVLQIEIDIFEKYIFVKDNGIGIEEKYLSKIGEPFYRIHAKSEYEGSGLGLSICKKIIEKHDGKFKIESFFGKGTTIFFSLHHS